ncbi:hypothetical protein LEP1GSC103_1920 [Leptospira borgpetersenii serovar Javanica str. UI 09931]|uniref:Uncharacterized protein n=4 Tax=Leptospira borgpetersenii TaxID=174 RepID=M3FK16_LEPBO|nr:hypothetical protein LBBP_02493 [Leptospira borgpetersenii serovar Ballum]EKP13547.1 hypothetical protein LEP1GSC128_2569 [Leptospira borgpetersenii str. 200801926]EKQ91721.1 hypothetical protein LEP1GSC101_0052 [Leptospira borgpetersenii str. UI 09149]EKR01552.1 hypothetical protein LEP1GSC121_2919 [Leptospira borgpetersenii serovar Castellonis str. 200801910]EMG02173.1 hypothetical protein LEP1GSC123_0803 [Leptospira borgpetersenii str. 200701203]EMN57007.1 hypothetical protein LEP1GSC090
MPEYQFRISALQFSDILVLSRNGSDQSQELFQKYLRTIGILNKDMDF